MSQILLCTLLVALLAGGPALSDHPTGTPPAVAAMPDAAVPDAFDDHVPDDHVSDDRAPDDRAPGDRAPGEEPSVSAGQFGWPLPGRPVVIRPFEPPAHRFGPGHRGVDLAAPPGTPVRAAGAGTVVFAGQVAGRGVVSIDHPGGLRTTYEPVAPSVTTGDVVSKGQQIGTVSSADPGHPGCADCLHWGVRRGTDYLDPLRLLGLGRLRLLPWDIDSGTSTLGHRLWDIDPGTSTLGHRPWGIHSDASTSSDSSSDPDSSPAAQTPTAAQASGG